MGNIGKSLTKVHKGVTPKEGEFSTFYSRNAGLTWEIVGNEGRVYSYEIGSYGSVFTLVDILKPTDTVLYSLNDAFTWKKLQFLENSTTNIINVITTPLNQVSHFFVLGVDKDKKDKTTIVQLNFSALEIPACRAPHQADSANSDYIIYGMESPLRPSCILG